MTGLPLKEHSVQIYEKDVCEPYLGLMFDAIDIDETGEINSYTPVVSSNALLRITMNDSSEREYQLSYDEISKFIEWCNRTVGTGNSLYVFDKTYNVGEFKTRKEYLLFEKIISFEVMELTK